MLDSLLTVPPDAMLGRSALPSGTSPEAEESQNPDSKTKTTSDREVHLDTKRAAPDEGWQREQAGAPARQLSADTARKILRPNDSPDLPFSQAVNPYRGCELGCIYCYARPAHAQLGLSPILDFDTRIFHKTHAPRLLRRELGKPGYKCTPTALGTNTDVYQSAERELLLTRNMLEVLYELRHPVSLLTKSSLILRDLELLAIMARSGLVQVLISLSTLDSELSRQLEPQAATPQARLDVISKLSAAGIPVGVAIAPVIPGLTDHEMEKLLAAAHQAGACNASYTVLRLPHELLEEFDRWLLWNAPKHASRLTAILYGRYGCKTGSLPVGNAIRGFERYTELLEQRFQLACQSIGFLGLPALNSSDFRAPQRAVPGEASDEQSRLF